MKLIKLVCEKLRFLDELTLAARFPHETKKIIMNEIQNILDVTFPFVKTLLSDYGEFYPLASAVNNNYEVEQVVREEDEENDFPKSTSVIGELKKELRSNRNNFKAIAIFYDVNVKERKTDAVAVSVEHKEERLAYIFYYAYEMVEGKPKFSESWKVVKEMEIFTE